MRCAFLLTLLTLAVRAEGPIREISLLNVELIDARGVKTALTGFHMLNGEHRFQGYLGSAEIEVSYRNLREIKVSPPSHPGGRMRANLLLRSGRTVHAHFDEREGELLMAGFAKFGRAVFYFRDVRLLKILGKTKRDDLPTFGKGTGAVDARATDRTGVVTELTGFRRAAGQCVLSGVRGSTTVTIPLWILKSFSLEPDKRTPLLTGQAVLKDGGSVRFLLPAYEERMLYRGDAEFGAYRIRLSELREVVIHRPTPRLRKLDPIEAARGQAVAEDKRQS